MKCATQLACLITAAWLGGTTMSPGATAEEQSCELLSAFTMDIGTALETAKRIVVQTSDAAFESIAPTLRALPSNFYKGVVLEVFRVDGLAIDHLIIVNSPTINNLYVRVFYERGVEGMIGTNLYFNSELQEMAKEYPIFAEPTAVPC